MRDTKKNEGDKKSALIEHRYLKRFDQLKDTVQTTDTDCDC